MIRWMRHPCSLKQLTDSIGIVQTRIEREKPGAPRDGKNDKYQNERKVAIEQFEKNPFRSRNRFTVDFASQG